jgi:hypothetical protein
LAVYFGVQNQFRRFSLLVALGLVLLAAGCPKPAARASSAAWIPKQAPWPDNETSWYDVLRDSTLTGRTMVRIQAVAADSTTARRGTREYAVIATNTAISAGMTLMHDSIFALLTRDSLKSVSAFQVRNLPTRQDTVISRYQGNHVVLTTNGGRTASLDAPENTYDNSILLTVIRTLDLKPESRFSLSSVASFGPWTKPADLTVVGVDSITVPAGKFVCNHCALEIAGYTLDLWYEQPAPHRYVKFENKSGGSSAVLSSYESGR